MHTYKTITAEQQEQMRQQRLAQFEAEHFNHEMNKIAVSSLPEGEAKERAIKQAEEAQATIEAAIEALETASPTQEEAT